MRKIVLSKSFVQDVQRFGNSKQLLGIVKALAIAIDQVPSDIAEGMIYHMLVTGTLAGKDFSREEIELSLLELCRVRREKGDKFNAPTERWFFLKDTEEYQMISSCVGNELEVGMVMHTIVSYLKGGNKFDTIVSRMEMIIERLERKGNNIEEDKKREEAMLELFSTVLFTVCTCKRFLERYEYICGMARKYGQREFVKAFAALFVMLAKEKPRIL